MILNVVKALCLSVILNFLLAGFVFVKGYSDIFLLCQANDVDNANKYEQKYLNNSGLAPLESEINRNEWLNMNDNHKYDYYSTDDNYNDDDDDHFDGTWEDNDSLFSEW